MNVRRLDHVNLRTANLQALADFYSSVLGFNPGPRPAFSFPGVWLYCEQTPVVHLVGVEEQPQSGELQLEHFAFQGEDLQAFLSHLKSEGVPCRIVEIADFGITQVNVYDPDGNHFHVDFADAV